MADLVDTEVGRLPSTWTVERLDRIADIVSGGTPSKARPEWWTGSIPWVSPKDMKVPRLRDVADYITEEAAAAGSRIVPAKSIFLVVRGMILAKSVPVAIAEGPMAFNQDMKAIIAREGVDPDFLFYAIRSRTSTLAQEISTSAHGTRRMGSQAVEGLTVPMPKNPKEQSSIVRILSRLEDALAVQAKAVAALKELKAATMAKCFREGLRGGPTRETEIGNLPSHWDVRPLGELLAEPIRNGHSARETQDERGIRTLTLSAVTRRDFSPKNTKLTSANPDRVADLWLKDGDVLVERANTIDRVGLAALYRGRDDYAIFPDLLMRVRVDSAAIEPELLVEWVMSPWCRSYFSSRARGAATNMPKIDQGTLEDVPIPVPPREERADFVSVIRTLDARLASAHSKLNALGGLFSSALQQLMCGDLRVTALLEG